MKFHQNQKSRPSVSTFSREFLIVFKARVLPTITHSASECIINQVSAMIASILPKRLNSDTLTIAEQQLDDSARRFYALSLGTLIQPARVNNFFLLSLSFGSFMLLFLHRSPTTAQHSEPRVEWSFVVFFSAALNIDSLHCYFFLFQFYFDRHREQSSWVFVAIQLTQTRSWSCAKKSNKLKESRAQNFPSLVVVRWLHVNGSVIIRKLYSEEKKQSEKKRKELRRKQKLKKVEQVKWKVNEIRFWVD